MIYLFTGQPGAQKTANMIHFVLSDSQFQNRPVFYYNITECTVPDWTPLTEQDVQRWYELPEGSVILIDEAQTIFRPQKWDKAKEKMVTELETHRHHGFDIVMTTQHPMLINTDVRRQVQQHRHYKKPYGVKSTAKVWERCVNDPDDFHDLKEATSMSGKVPKDVFSLYKSTALNTHKARIPKKVYMFGAALLGVLYLGYSFYQDRIRPEASSVSSTDSASLTESLSNMVKPAKPTQGSSFKPFYPLDPGEYIKLHTPRIDGLPATAPIYDELSRPTVAPKVRCYGYYRGENYHCNCVTQQMTPVEMDYDQCVHVVNNGMWDPAPITSASYNARGQRM